jgi:hypothetical protein
MSVNDDTIKNAMDLTAMMAVSEIAGETGKTPAEVLVAFMNSRTGKMLYNDSTKAWWDGPSAIADSYLKEKNMRRRSA